MISKLIKYDVKKILGFLVYFYVISFGFSVITRLINIGKDIQFVYIIGQVFAGISYATIAQILVNIFTQTLKCFINDFYKDESYLTHTLPVTKHQLLLSKYLTALIVIAISVLVCFIDLFIILYTPELFDLIKYSLNVTVIGFEMQAWVLVLILAFIILFQVLAMMSMAFFAIVKSNTYNSKRAIKGFIWFFICYFVSMSITLILAIIIFAITGNIESIFANLMSQSAFITLLILALVCYAIYALAFYFLCHKTFNKGVNVD